MAMSPVFRTVIQMGGFQSWFMCLKLSCCRNKLKNSFKEVRDAVVIKAKKQFLFLFSKNFQNRSYLLLF